MREYNRHTKVEQKEAVETDDKIASKEQQKEADPEKLPDKKPSPVVAEQQKNINNHEINMPLPVKKEAKAHTAKSTIITDKANSDDLLKRIKKILND